MGISEKAFQRLVANQQASKASPKAKAGTKKAGKKPKASPKAGAHAIRNASNQRAGESFQSRLDAYHAELSARRLATVYRTQPDIVQTGTASARVVGKGPVDYVAWLANGSTIFFDAKSRAADFTLGADFEHQTQMLRTMYHYGHKAGFLIWWSTELECRWHPIQKIQKRVRRADGQLMAGIQWFDFFYPNAVR